MGVQALGQRARCCTVSAERATHGGAVQRLRYRIKGRRYTKTFRGTKAQAQKALRDLLHAGDTGAHVDPDKMTVAQWIEHWLSIGAPSNKRRRSVGARSLERYTELLRCHVLPGVGDRPLQQFHSTEIDTLYERLSDKLSASTVCNIHSILGACFGTAKRTRKLAQNPMDALAKVPSLADVDHGMVLEQDELRTLIAGFRGLSLFPIVATAAFTGARRNEILALRWEDLNVANKTIRIERALEETAAHGLRMKAPKTARGKRTIKIDDELLALLLAERERHLRIVAGVPDGTAVDLSLVKLPVGALMFPAVPTGVESLSFTKPRNPRPVTTAFLRHARRLGFPGLRFHDLRGTHETLLLDRGVPLHVVADRCGHSPAVLLRAYAKRTRKADDSAAEVIAAMSKGALQ
jgi:integrase